MDRCSVRDSQGLQSAVLGSYSSLKEKETVDKAMIKLILDLWDDRSDRFIEIDVDGNRTAIADNEDT